MTGPRRIAHVSDGYLPRLGGIELHVRDLAARQRAAGQCAEILTATPADPSLAGERHVHRLAGTAPARGIQARLAAGEYDAVHVHASVVSPLATAGLRSATRLGVPTLVTVHSMWNGLGPLPRWFLLAHGMPGLPVHWSGVSSVVVSQVERAFGGRTRVDLAPNGIDVDYWRRAAAPQPRPEVVVAATMRFAARKQPAALLHALRGLRRLVPADQSIRAVLVGDGPRLPAARRYVCRHGLADWVDLPGRATRAQVRRTLGAADVFVAPARRESFGLAALEARCAGLPVVAMRSSGVVDFVEHGREGLLADDPQDLTACLARLCTDRDLRSRIRGHNLARPPASDWDDVLARTDELYARSAAHVRTASSGRAAPDGVSA